jgi:predicted nucleic acid-binding Zn ribbon protein
VRPTGQDGDQGRGPELLGHLLPGLLRARGISRQSPVGKIHDVWVEMVGEEVSKHTLVRGCRSGVLGVEVDSAPWLQELASFRREEILERLQERLPDVQVHDIKFTIRG